jgi:hypothetical protein
LIEFGVEELKPLSETEDHETSGDNETDVEAEDTEDDLGYDPVTWNELLEESGGERGQVSVGIRRVEFDAGEVGEVHDGLGIVGLFVTTGSGFSRRKQLFSQISFFAKPHTGSDDEHSKRSRSRLYKEPNISVRPQAK